jgi:DNA-binding NtrC family response regulator
MKGRIYFCGESLELKLLRDSLEERGLEVEIKTLSELEGLVKENEPDVVVIELTDKVSSSFPKLINLLKSLSSNVVFLANKISVEKAVELIKAGAYDLKLISSPLEVIERTVLLALEDKRLILEEEGFLTQDPRLVASIKRLEQVAKTDAPILLVGESGTGKELLARFVHAKSERRFGPFVAINCAALPETLLESELFGYEKGAFSGANFRKKGKIELAHGGTLLLDEITETTPQFQSKLLRVIQEKEVDRLGGYYPIKVDFRLISTTNRDIEKVVAEGKFRQDLYFRINVIAVKIPPLRERRGDVKLLTEHFVEKFSRMYKNDVKGLTDRAWKFLMNYPFPGNVRELKNMIERGVLTCEGELIDLPHLVDPFSSDYSFEPISRPHFEPAKGQPEPFKSHPHPLNSHSHPFNSHPHSFNRHSERSEGSPQEEGPSKDAGMIFEYKDLEVKPLDELEREAILRALKLTGGNKAKAAELLGITVRTIRNKLKQYEELGLIKRGEFGDVG